MTVRTWITISVLALVALASATAYQFLRPIEPPAIVVHAGDERVDGAFDGACWPQRNGILRCTRGNEKPEPQTIPARGTLRIVIASPAQPKVGSIKVTDDNGKTVIDRPWQRTLRHDLEPGGYTLTSLAGESDKAFVRYVFRLRVTRSGS